MLKISDSDFSRELPTCHPPPEMLCTNLPKINMALVTQHWAFLVSWFLRLWILEWMSSGIYTGIRFFPCSCYHSTFKTCLYLPVHLCRKVYQVYADVCRSQKRVSKPPPPELELKVSHQAPMLLQEHYALSTAVLVEIPPAKTSSSSSTLLFRSSSSNMVFWLLVSMHHIDAVPRQTTRGHQIALELALRDLRATMLISCSQPVSPDGLRTERSFNRGHLILSENAVIHVAIHNSSKVTVVK